MNILLTVHYDFDPNAGAAGVTWQLGQAYQKLGHRVSYYSIDRLPLPTAMPWVIRSALFPEFVAGHIQSLQQQAPIDVIDASTGDLWVWSKLFRPWSRSRPVLVTRDHGLEHTEHLAYVEEARQGNLKLGWKYPLYHGGFRLWEVGASLRCADVALMLNSQALKYATTQLGVDPNQAYLNRNGIPDFFLNLPLEPTPPPEDGTIRIAQIANYIGRKGINYAAPALNRILRRYPQVEVSLLGTVRPEAEVYADFAPEVRDRVRVLPRYDNQSLPQLLRGHQIKLLASFYEGFGIALLEAMACGLAPIATRTTGPMDIIHDGQDGLLIPPRDSAAIEQAIARLIEDRAYLDQLRHQAHATAQQYSWNQIAQDTLTIYETAIARKKDWGIAESKYDLPP